MERYWADPEKARERIRLQARKRRVKSIVGAPETRPPADAVCEICLKVPKKMCLDHCHTTQAFRGWLCEGCNFGLGNYQDRPELLDRAAEYLRRFNSRR